MHFTSPVTVTHGRACTSWSTKGASSTGNINENNDNGSSQDASKVIGAVQLFCLGVPSDTGVRFLVCGLRFLGVGSNESFTTLWSSKPPIDARLVTDGPSHRRACLTGYTDSGKATGPLKGLSSLLVFLVELCALVA